MRCVPVLSIVTLALLAGSMSSSAGEYPPPEPVAPPARHTAAKPHAKTAQTKTAHVKKPPANKAHAQKAVAAKPKPAPVAKLHKTTPLPRPAPQAKSAKAAAPKAAVAKPLAAKPPAPKADTAKSAARTSVATGPLAGLPPEDRLRIQASLFWSGDYTGASGGEDPMVTAIKNFQKRIKNPVTGVLTPAERERLVTAARDHERRFGWNVVVDPATGIRIGLPTRLVPQAHEAARGTRWSSPHGEVQIETFRIHDPTLKLATLFEREKREPASRRVEYSVLHDNDFFISGMQGLKEFSVRARTRDGEVRGFTMLFDQAMEGIVEPVMVAIASAFSPFPERSAPFAALAKSVEYGNGVVVSTRGHIVTDRRLVHGCKVILADGSDADLVAEDEDEGLALLRIYGPRKLTPLTLDSYADGKAGDLRLVGLPEPSAHSPKAKLTEIKARLADGRSIELREPVPMAGFTGAAALDAQGRFVGLMEMRGFVLASNEPAAPPVKLVPAVSLRDFLAAHGVPGAPNAITDAKASVVRVICVRK
ncbi:MAG TPA: serine protease [Pseudolabrys sp.]|nr:serine protease [Pseudolabrys sp.]